MSKPDIFTMLENFISDRPVMAQENQDIGKMLSMITGELMELIDAVELNQGVDSIAEEASDLAIVAISIISLLGRDPEAEIRQKIGFNTLRYEAHLFDGKHDYDTARKISKTLFTQADKEQVYSDT